MKLLRSLRRAALVAVIIFPAACAASAPRPAPGAILAPFVPTPQDVVDRMLKLAAVTKEDIVYDLGSGDGRIVISAARTYGARGVGIDIDPARIAESVMNARTAGVGNLVQFRHGDILTADVSAATVVTLYLVSSANVKLRPLLAEQLRPGARVVSHAFGMGDWAPAETDRFVDSQGDERVLYLWRVGRASR